MENLSVSAVRNSFTFMLPCIVIDFFLNNQPDAIIIQIYSVIKLCMFQASSRRRRESIPGPSDLQRSALCTTLPQAPNSYVLNNITVRFEFCHNYPAGQSKSSLHPVVLDSSLVWLCRIFHNYLGNFIIFGYICLASIVGS